jgi:hypothetical protein
VIAEDAVRLETVASEVVALRRSQQHSQALARRNELLGALLQRLDTATPVGTALSSRLGEIRGSSPSFEKAVESITEWRLALDRDLEQALTGDLFGRLQAALDSAIREVEQRAATTWQRYIAQNTPESSPAILAALAADPDAQVTVRDIKRIGEAIRRLRELPIPTIQQLNEFDATVEELRAAWSKLDVAGLDDEIVAFLRAANSDAGADIELLTSAVSQWLEDRGASSHYVIRPANQ